MQKPTFEKAKKIDGEIRELALQILALQLWVNDLESGKANAPSKDFTIQAEQKYGYATIARVYVDPDSFVLYLKEEIKKREKAKRKLEKEFSTLTDPENEN